MYSSRITLEKVRNLRFLDEPEAHAAAPGNEERHRIILFGLIVLLTCIVTSLEHQAGLPGGSTLLLITCAVTMIVSVVMLLA
ncbi:MAG: hypothetical protein RDV48_20550 [Candidatus Eremiobacteraeota bacterium]|nr:hypothetical protein [Candidatus Eremiobacteraeota bacterium]